MTSLRLVTECRITVAHPPGKMSYQVWVRPVDGSWNRRIRASFDLASGAPRVSHRRVRRAVRALSPALSRLTTYSAVPFFTSARANCQPVGRDRTQGTSVAEGTAWASSHSGTHCRQPRLAMRSEVVLLSLRVNAERLRT